MYVYFIFMWISKFTLSLFQQNFMSSQWLAPQASDSSSHPFIAVSMKEWKGIYVPFNALLGYIRTATWEVATSICPNKFNGLKGKKKTFS